jgi:quinol monooxygenase YgiN
VLEIVAIKRKDGGEWALPGGMVDPGESVSVTLKREFGEEALNSFDLEEKQRAVLVKQMDALFSNGKPLYRGYVDDRRNTDNAWMETTCVSIHDESGDLFQLFPLSSGDDAIDVTWIEYSNDLSLYANHVHFLALALHFHQQPEQYEPPMVGGMRSFRVDSVKRTRPTSFAAGPVPPARTDSGSYSENGAAGAAAAPAIDEEAVTEAVIPAGDVPPAIHLGVHAIAVDGMAADFIAHTLTNAVATVAEAGVVDFLVLQQDENPAHIAILEVYRDDSAIAAHGETEHCESWRTNTKDLCTRSKAKWAMLPHGGPNGRLLSASATQSVAVILDLTVQPDRLPSAIAVLQKFIAASTSDDDKNYRALQQQPDWDGNSNVLRVQCLYSSSTSLEKNAAGIDDLLLSLCEMKAAEPVRNTFSVLS